MPLNETSLNKQKKLKKNEKIMKINQAIHHIVYGDNPAKAPKGVSQVRWNAIEKHIRKNWKIIKKSMGL